MKKMFIRKSFALSLRKLLFFFFLLLSSSVVYGQCPIASSCTPGNPPAANLIFGMGILNVNIANGAINHTTLVSASGYQNYSCTVGTSLLANTAHPFSIQTNANVNENVRAWIDYNNDGIFNATTELAFSSVNNKLHVGSFTIPGTAVTNVPLRMRISADNFSSTLPTPCSNPLYSQAEDYRITVLPNNNPPVAEFSASTTTTCSPTVSFTDLSQNGPTSWTWTFGDPASGAANTSTQQNPSHTFSAPGTYTITLTACVGTLCNTLVKTAYITYHNNVPVAATCSPPTNSFCCGYGITNVNFGSGLMTNTSANGQAGYQDFTCTKSATVIAGNAYPIALTSGANPQDTRIYIDLNNDGDFTDPNEMALQILNEVNPDGILTIPGTTLINTPLRMRIVSDEIGSTFTSCAGIQSGQAEDYTLIITPNPNPPVAQFTSNYATACDTTIQFTDQSSNAPTSWLWNFGDPASGALNTSTLPNPVHIYHNAGNYTVTLTATNAINSDIEEKINYITVVKPCIIYCTPSGNNTNLHISNVTLGTINNTSGQAGGSYSNFTSLSTTLVQGSNATLNVTRAGFNFSNVAAWIDYNRNGTFETAEKIMTVNNSNGVATVNFTVPATAVLGPTRLRVMTGNFGPLNDPCASSNQTRETEDYTINIVTNQQPPIVNFVADNPISCNGIVQFTDNSINIPTTWLWDFGDPASGANNTSTLQSPVHTFSTPGQYTISLTASNGFGPNTVTKTNYINYDPANTFCTQVIMPTTGTGPTATLCNGSIFDPGGPAGQYMGDANGVTTIAPSGAASITLTFSAFDLEAGFDFLKVFDGPSTSSTLIGTFTGNTLPAAITSTGSALTLQFTSDNIIQGDGFAAAWTCTPITTKPDPKFKADLNNICTGLVAFEDMSTNSPTAWTWDFGDGSPVSTLKNPSHTYQTTTPNSYTVSLIACNSFGCDTIVKTNYINITVPCFNYCPSNGHGNTDQWISKVELGTINNTSGPETNGYGNYTSFSNNIMLGTTGNQLSVTFGTTNFANGFATVWIDLNKDGTFSATERVMNVAGTSSGFGNPVVATGNITIPSNAVTGPTRMRIIMSQNFNLMDPCTNNQFRAETEDYTINIQPNTLPTTAEFSADLNTICTGVVQFTDESTNGATSWTWDFGDGTPTSNLKNPSHTYQTTNPTSYNITLTACKGTVCDTEIKTNYVNITVPCLTYCASSGHTNTDQWISKVESGTINNTSGANTNGYANFTHLSNNIMLGTSTTPISVTLGNNFGPFAFVTIWIDFNKNGTFQANERVLNTQAMSASFGDPLVASGTITLPNNAVTGPTRMRIIMSQNFNLTNACVMNQFTGETEDYTINIQPNTLPTTAEFSANLNTICTGVVQFTDESTNGATSWTWDFGDGTPTSNLKNPSHTYQTTTPTSYNVTLTACKGTVCDTEVKTNYVNITVPCLTYCASSGHTNTDQWIGKVEMGSINNSTGPNTNGYGNYTHLSTNAMLGLTINPVSVTLGNNFGPFGFVAIWIDLNKNGTFQPNERVFNEQATNFGGGNPVATGTIAIPSTATTGPTRMRIIFSQNFNLTNACIMNQFSGETEDYTINIQPNTLPTTAQFSANLNTICTGVIQFTDESTNGATSWTWDFGDGTPTSNLKNPSHTYQTTTPTSYNVTLTACKGTVCDTEIKSNFVNITVPCFTYCNSSGHNNTDQWISKFDMGTVSNTSGANTNGYGNYSYLSNSVIMGTSTPVTVTLGNNFGPQGFVAIWIDLNKDGVFQANERMFNVMASAATFGQPLVATGNIMVPTTAATGPTRMRVIMSQNFNLTNACIMNQFMAETEDYGINISVNTVPPITNFSATPTNTCNGIVNFTDLSVNNPTSWSWNFGDPGSGASNTSTARNPSHTFSTPGVYTITLTTCNIFGCNPTPFVKTAYINYDPTNASCFTVNMPVTGSVTNTNCSGTLFDNGGPTNVYANDVNGTVVLAPAGASTVALTFKQFDTEAGFDFVTIHDGSSTASPVIGTFSGFVLPNGGNPIVSTGNALTVHFNTDNFGQFPGFEATWSCVTGTGPDDLKNTAIEVFPNPTSGLTTVRIPKSFATGYSLEITNVLGKTVMIKENKNAGTEEQVLDLRHLAKGVYFIKIYNETSSGIKKIVKD